MKTYPVLLLLVLSLTQNMPAATYPLQIGNRWDYGETIEPDQWSYYYTARIIGDTLMPNGHTYFIENSNQDGGSHTRYLCQSESIVYSYSSQGEIILYDFFRQNGDTISVVYTSDDTIITTLQIENTLLFGQEWQTWKYFTKFSHSSMYGIEYVADGIGYAGYWGEPGWGYGCMGAIINGKKYGTIVSVPPSEKSNPTKFALMQNYPNPFNPSTNIMFSIPAKILCHSENIRCVRKRSNSTCKRIFAGRELFKAMECKGGIKRHIFLFFDRRVI